MRTEVRCPLCGRWVPTDGAASKTHCMYCNAAISPPYSIRKERLERRNSFVEMLLLGAIVLVIVWECEWLPAPDWYWTISTAVKQSVSCSSGVPAMQPAFSTPPVLSSTPPPDEEQGYDIRNVDLMGDGDDGDEGCGDEGDPTPTPGIPDGARILG